MAFYEQLAPFAEPFMALFRQNQLPHRSTFSRFLAALDQTAVEALRIETAFAYSRVTTARISGALASMRGATSRVTSQRKKPP